MKAANPAALALRPGRLCLSKARVPRLAVRGALPNRVGPPFRLFAPSESSPLESGLLAAPDVCINRCARVCGLASKKYLSKSEKATWGVWGRRADVLVATRGRDAFDAL